MVQRLSGWKSPCPGMSEKSVCLGLNQSNEQVTHNGLLLSAARGGKQDGCD